MNFKGLLYSRNLGRRLGAFFTLVAVFLSGVAVPCGYAQTVILPPAESRIELSPAFAPSLLKGIKVYRHDPFRFDFILDKGDVNESDDELKTESNRLVKYFLASLAVPEKDIWVNLSPYEKDRIVSQAFGQTEMGRDLLAQDYVLKQVTASIINPESEIGREFWAKVYDQAQRRFGTSFVSVNTFNKVWIIPEKAEVYENKDAAFIIESKLKVMLEEDYFALEKNIDVKNASTPDVNKLGSDIVREVVIPILEKEVNEGKNFTTLRQVYNSLILATWYKRKLRDSVLGQGYVDKKKTVGIDIKDKNEKERIWGQYIVAFKQGVYNFIREEYDSRTHTTVPRKYFSGGIRPFNLDIIMNITTESLEQKVASSQVNYRALQINLIPQASSEDGRLQLKLLFNNLPEREQTIVDDASDQQIQEFLGVFSFFSSFDLKGVDLAGKLKNILYQSPDFNYFLSVLNLVKNLCDTTSVFQLGLINNLSILLQRFHPSLDEIKNFVNSWAEYVLIDQEPSHILNRIGRFGNTHWSLTRDGNDAGLADFVAKALFTKTLKPSDIHELMIYAKNVPGINAQIFEQNRRDAYVLDQLMKDGRDLIHDQKVGSYQVLMAWIEYYEKGDRFLSQQNLFGVDLFMPPQNVRDFMPDGRFYGKDIMGILNSTVLFPEPSTEKVIDVIRRLAKNVDIINKKPPRVANHEMKIGYLEFDKALNKLYIHSRGKNKTDTKALYYALKEANKILSELNSSNKQGVMPNFILSLIWLENKCFSALREVRESRYAEYDLELLYKTPWFTPIVEFFFRIYSPNQSTYLTIPDVRRYSPETAYLTLYNSAISFATQLSKQYKGRDKYRAQLWTGNLIDAFIMLKDASNLSGLQTSRIIKPSISKEDYFWELVDLPDSPTQVTVIDEEATNQNPGGINFASMEDDLMIKNKDEIIKFDIDPDIFKRLQDSSGVAPVIISIRPLESLDAFFDRTTRMVK